MALPPDRPAPRASPAATRAGRSSPCATRWARSWSARRARCRAWSPRCWCGATCCSRACPAWPRRCWSRRMAAALDLDFKRVQFTPDLMPSDVIGQVDLRAAARARSGSGRARCSPTCCWPTRSTARRRRPRPRCSRRWRSARSSIEGVTHPLPDPFIVVATQNPVEYEGTYPLPEAQLDRFLFKLQVGYPTFEQEQEVLARHDQGLDPHDIAAAGRAAGGQRRRPGRGPGRRSSALRVEAPVHRLHRARWCGPRASRRRWRSACRPAAPPRCCTRPRRGRGWPGATS